MQGATLVMPFAWLELLAVGAALLAFTFPKARLALAT
jgi:hypothetical protein